jgi:hypothetical protein
MLIPNSVHVMNFTYSMTFSSEPQVFQISLRAVTGSISSPARGSTDTDLRMFVLALDERKQNGGEKNKTR